jgi:hypothetical protein
MTSKGASDCAATCRGGGPVHRPLVQRPRVPAVEELHHLEPAAALDGRVEREIPHSIRLRQRSWIRDHKYLHELHGPPEADRHVQRKIALVGLFLQRVRALVEEAPRRVGPVPILLVLRKCHSMVQRDPPVVVPLAGPAPRRPPGPGRPFLGRAAGHARTRYIAPSAVVA